MRKDKKNMRQLFASKSLKAGSYSLAVCAVALVIAVVVNLIAGTLPSKIMQPDLSVNGLYTLSDHSVRVAKDLKQDVTIYHLTTSAARDERLSKLLERYADLSRHIKIEERDPQISQIASQYTKDELSENSLIFVSDKRNKVVDYNSIMTYSEQMQMYAYYGQNVSPDEFNGEREITSALDFVTKDTLPKVYTLTGHGEISLDTSVSSQVAYENIEVNTLDLAKEKTVPDDCACLIILSPDSDMLEEELDAIRDYFSKGGNLLVSSLVPIGLKGKTANFDALLSELGIENGEGMVVEGDESAIFSRRADYLIPQMESHEIMDPIIDNDYHVYFPYVREMHIADSLRSSLSVKAMMHTSDSSFARTDMTIESPTKSEGDVDGPFDVAFAVTETLDDVTAHAVVLATSYFLDPGLSSYPGNISLLINSLKWMCDLEETMDVIETKSLQDAGSLEIANAASLPISAILTVIVPLIVLVVGVVIFVRRKKR